jgi:diguanylate cyclase (GGDEF)-like protein/hemerythrin-like metal-binding protein/PAS domain S-box-containing protein
MSEKLIDIFPWNEHFLTGIELIDSQHLKLVDILNRLANHIAFNSSEIELHILFHELLDYVDYHFEAEEHIWSTYLVNDPSFESHVDDHHAFSEQIIQLQQAIHSQPKHEVLSETLRFLTRWLVSHILENDMYLAFVVQFVQSGHSVEQAKLEAKNKIEHSSKRMLDFVLTIYETLSGNTYHLVKQIHEYELVLAELKEHQARLIEMQQYAQIGYWDFDLIQKKGTWSDQTYRIFGLSKSVPAHPDTLKQIIDPKDFDLLEHAVAHAVKNGEEYHHEYNITRPSDNQVRRLESHANVIYDELGVPLRIAGFVQDVTEKTTTQSQIQVQENQLRFIADNIPVFLAQINKNGFYTFANKQYAELYNTTTKTLIGRHCRDVLGSDIYQEVRTHIERVLEGHVVSFIRYHSKPKAQLLVRYVPEFNADGEVIGFIVSTIDISERLEAERFDHFYTKILEYLTAERDLDFILNEITIGIESFYAESICSINLLNNTGDRFEQVYGSSVTETIRDTLKTIDISTSSSSSGKTASTGKYTISDDVLLDESWSNLTSFAKQLEIASCWSFPLVSSIESTLGTLTIYHHHKKAFTDKELIILQRCAKLASIVVANIRHRQQLKIASIVFESEHEGMMVTDKHGHILQVNQTFKDITGYNEKDVIGATPNMLSSGQHDVAFYEQMWQTITESGTWSGEIYNRRKNGDIYPELLRISAVYDSMHKKVVNYVATFTDMTSDKKTAENLERLAFYDQLTSLPNRRLFHDRLERALVTSKRDGKLGFLLLIDIDKFKIINDIHGHEFGDRFLCQFSERLQTCLREQDTLARISSDEFIVIIEHLSQSYDKAIEDVNAIAEKVLIALSQPFEIDAVVFKSTVSIGISLFEDHKVSATELLKQIDIALLNAKSQGGNQFCYFDPEMQNLINHRAMLEQSLEHAIHHDELSLYLQGQADESGHINGAEALVRWHHPEKGLISPAEFIPLAEETGLILPLGDWVLFEGCRLLKQLQSTYQLSEFSLSVNVSAKQFYQINFSDTVKKAIYKSGIDPRQLKLEITESILVSDISTTITVMNELAKLGVRFSMDDFGTGYSSL